MNKEKGFNKHTLLTVVGAVLCAILIPILVVNVTLIVKSFVNEEEVPSFGGYLPLFVLTDSMYPEIESGDLIICQTIDASEIKVGDVISFFDPEGNGTSVVTHEVIEIPSVPKVPTTTPPTLCPFPPRIWWASIASAFPVQAALPCSCRPLPA